jgi:hypothetical protein
MDEVVTGKTEEGAVDTVVDGVVVTAAVVD